MVLGSFSSLNLINVEAEEPKIEYNASAVAEVDVPFVTLQTLDSVFSEEDGIPVSYTTATGNIAAGAPAIFNVIDMRTKEVIDFFLLEDAASA